LLEQTRKEVAEVPMPRVRLAEMGDKYAEGESVEIDCASRIHLCHARCCSFKFFLTKQDLDEGVAKWDYGNPYWIKQAADGYCIHSDPATRGCLIHAKRPHVCRRYDCRNDKRVWIDFEKRIPAPMPERQPDAPVAMAEMAMQNSIRMAADEAGRRARCRRRNHGTDRTREHRHADGGPRPPTTVRSKRRRCPLVRITSSGPPA